ncbi:hypothetical protein GCM10009760_36120 [Kitasatospora kazusensis]|uniref:Uncharacterized protein n=1 Tax=Kitasatospora kazusensis TaxID=407974 RepID=A0ABP5LK10_9ACTN
MQALTSRDADERLRLARLLAHTDAGTGSIHESFHSDDQHTCTRAWFGWGKALFSEVVLELTGCRASGLHPARRTGTGTDGAARRAAQTTRFTQGDFW